MLIFIYELNRRAKASTNCVGKPLKLHGCEGAREKWCEL